MTDRYTDNVNGSDSANGTTDTTPKQHFSSHVVNNGDTFYFKGTGVPYDNNPGDTWTVNLQNKADVWVKQWPGFPKPIITQTHGTGSGRGIRIGGGGGICGVQGIILQDTLESAIGDPGHAATTLYVIDCEMYRCGLTQSALTLGGGVTIGGTTPIANLFVRNSIISYTGRPGVYARVVGTYEVDNTDIDHVGQQDLAGNTGDCVQTDGAPTLYWVHDCVLDHGDKNSKQCVQQSGGTTGLCIIEDCTLIGPMDGTGNSHKHTYTEQRTIVRRCHMDGGGIAVDLHDGGQVYSNLILVRGDGWGGNVGPIFIENATGSGTDVDNNTIVYISGTAKMRCGIYMIAGSGHIRNNIVVSNGGFSSGIRRHATNVSESYNDLYGATVTAVEDPGLSPLSLGTGTITSNPNLDGNYVPHSAAVLGAGVRISDGMVDLNGVAFGYNTKNIPMMPFIASGRLDGARIMVERAFAPDAQSAFVGGLYVFEGRVSESPAISRYAAKLTVRSDSELLNGMVPRNVYQPGCSNTLFDSTCLLNMASFKVTQTAVSGLDAAKTTFSITNNQPAGFYGLGRITGNAGLNAGVVRSVKTSTTGAVTVIQPWPLAVSVGDTFDLLPGCDKTKATCIAKFNNVVHFRGYPYVPAPETIV